MTGDRATSSTRQWDDHPDADPQHTTIGCVYVLPLLCRGGESTSTAIDVAVARQVRLGLLGRFASCTLSPGSSRRCKSAHARCRWPHLSPVLSCFDDSTAIALCYHDAALHLRRSQAPSRERAEREIREARREAELDRRAYAADEAATAAVAASTAAADEPPSPRVVPLVAAPRPEVVTPAVTVGFKRCLRQAFEDSEDAEAEAASVHDSAATVTDEEEVKASGSSCKMARRRPSDNSESPAESEARVLESDAAWTSDSSDSDAGRSPSDWQSKWALADMLVCFKAASR